MSSRPTFPEVESTLFNGLLRVRRVTDSPRIVLGEDPAPAPAPAPASAASEPEAKRRRYEFHGEIGRGGMGAVYQVLDTDLHRVLAMKVALGTGQGPDGQPSELDPQLLTRFLEEAQVTGQLDHPGIVPLHELGMDSQGRVYFTMRLVKGRHLGQIFELAWAREEGWTQERVVTALIRVCEAMAYAHSKGVVHRDIKPANVMAGRFGEVYVMDWGLAKVRGRPERTQTSGDFSRSFVLTTRKHGESDDDMPTSHGTVFGTPAFMAPEQARGDVDAIDARSDIYSVGAMLYNFLAGRPPYVRPGARVSATVLLGWVLDGPPQPLAKLAPEAPPELIAICEKAMAREQQQRYLGMLDLAEDLRRFQAGRPVAALPLSRVARVRRWCLKNRVVAALLVAISLGSAYGLWCLTNLSTELVRQSALDSARMKTDIMQEVNNLYAASVTSRVDREHVNVTHDYANVAGAIPLPATFLTELGARISEHAGGVQVRHYSDYPFRFRQPWPLDGFEQQALASLRLDPVTPVVQFETVEGKSTLRYAVARRMEAACVACHNTHPESTKTDWKVGDVRGVLEVVRPLDQDVERTRAGVRGTLFLVAGIVGGLLLLSVVTLVRQSKGGLVEGATCELPSARAKKSSKKPS